MIGLIRSRNEFFCDLNCKACQGFKNQGCLLCGIRTVNPGDSDLCTPMASAGLTCFAGGFLLGELYAPMGVWKELFVLDKTVRPEIEFLQYKNEVEN